MPFLRHSGGGQIASRVAAAQIVDFAPSPMALIPLPAQPHHGRQCQQEGYTNPSRDHVRELHGITSVGLCNLIMPSGLSRVS